MEEYRKNMILQLTHKLHEYLHSNKGKQEILNPPHEKPIQDTAYRKLGKEVKDRIERGIQKWSESDAVKCIVDDADAKIKLLLTNMESKMQGIEIEMLGNYHRDYTRTGTFFLGLGIGLSLAFFPIAWMFPVVISVLMTPIFVMVDWFIDSDFRRKKAEEIYDECLKQIDVDTLHKSFEKSLGTKFEKVLEHIFNDEIPKTIETLSKTNDKLFQDSELIRNKEGAFMKLEVMVDEIQKKMKRFREMTFC